MRGGVAKKWTTERCVVGRSSGPASNDFGDQRLLRRVLCCFNRGSMGSLFWPGPERTEAWSGSTNTSGAIESTSMLCSASFHILFARYIVPIERSGVPS